MLFQANHSTKKITLGYTMYEIQKGQSCNSMREWARIFNAGNASIYRFFELLENEGMITRKTIGRGKRSSTLINITHYNDYQGSVGTQEERKNSPKTVKALQKAERTPAIENTDDNNVLPQNAETLTVTQEERKGVTNNKYNNYNKESKKKTKVFSPPTIQEIYHYMTEEKKIVAGLAEIESQKFFNHFESSGWKLKGGNKMVSWKASVNNWILRINDFKSTRDINEEASQKRLNQIPIG